MYGSRIYKLIAFINMQERALFMIEQCHAFPSLRIDDKTEQIIHEEDDCIEISLIQSNTTHIQNNLIPN